MDASQRFSLLITKDSLYKAEKKVLTKLKQLTQKIEKIKHADQPVKYFKMVLEILEDELDKRVQRFSPEQWLWYLRRLPDFVFAGKLSTTLGYNSALAEVYSSYSIRKYNRRHNLNDISFPVTPETIKHVLQFCCIVIQISRIHTNLRYAGKGAEFRSVDNDYLPHPYVPKEIEQSIILFDQRMEKSSIKFSRTGTVVEGKLSSLNSDNTSILCVYRSADAKFAQNFWQKIHQERQIELLLHRFYFVCVPLDKLVQLVNNDEISHSGWLSKDALVLIALQRIMIYLAIESPIINRHVPLVGYSVHSYNSLCTDPLYAYNDIIYGLEKSLPNRKFPTSMKEALDDAILLSGHPHPLKLGPVIRKAGDTIFLDWYSMAQRLNYELEFPNINGAIANKRGDHFELMVQSIIDNSTWKPSSNLESLRGRKLKYSENNTNKDITDIDAIGEKGHTLLMISCKSIIYSSQYDVGDYRTIRNQSSSLQNYVEDWEEKKRTLLNNLIGKNYDFRKYNQIIAVVCTLNPIYVLIGKATEYEADGLRKSVSVSELHEWLQSN